MACLFQSQYIRAQTTHHAPGVSVFQANDVRLDPSWIKSREELNTRYLLTLDPDRLLHNFKINAGLTSQSKPLGGWEAPDIGLRGHFTGHYLSAVALLVEQHKNPLLRQRLIYIVDELYKCQQALGKGYLSAFPERDFDTLEKTFGNVWAPYYTYHKIMQGLLDVYTHTGNEKAYDMVNQMASYVQNRMARLDQQSIEKILYTVGANPANEVGPMNEVMYNLYHVSHKPEHLVLAKLFDRDWFFRPLAENQDILSGLHSNTHLVLVNGFAQRAFTTGESVYLDAAKNFWNMLMHHHAYANGSSSGPRPNVTSPTSLTAEHWGVPDHLSNTMTKEIAESCVSHNSQKLTSYLFCQDQQPAYAETYMNTFYNAVMALQNGNTGAVVYHLPLGSPREKKFLKDDDFRCCNGTSIEAFASLNKGIYYNDAAAVWINLYVPSTLNWKEHKFILQQDGNFPADSTVTFTIKSAKAKALKLNFLIPGWAEGTAVYINGKLEADSPSAGTYLSINRNWKAGDQIKLVFHYRFYLKTMPDDENVFAIFYGPTLLAAETDTEFILKGTKQEILKNLIPEGSDVFKLRNADNTFTLRPLYEISNQTYGVYATLRNY
ncbi:beta-L-arabinofuranosidase domain-containing protein [uncultured Pedobacter sp.]|uniref:beta-L-arabinofuranosidase domain-containing protein n=1 Tax=uncultured Pedobacter sp. TaxID=246139 RepID=UPI0025CFF520|nr:beta-L-arabinofuranosidase domain-containing protein [uncultured Pedobacter sp.]